MTPEHAAKLVHSQLAELPPARPLGLDADVPGPGIGSRNSQTDWIDPKHGDGASISGAKEIEAFAR